MYYDDNFGHWHGENDADTQTFYRSVTRRSVTTQCKGCGRTVRLLPHYAYCDSCADVIERGGEF